MSPCPPSIRQQPVNIPPTVHRHILKAPEICPMQAHTRIALMLWVQGLCEGGTSTEAASEGDAFIWGRWQAFGRWSGCHGHQSHHLSVCRIWRLLQVCTATAQIARPCLLLTVFVHIVCDYGTVNLDELHLQAGWQLPAQACHAKCGVDTRHACAGLSRQVDTISHSTYKALPMRPGLWMCRRTAQG